MILSTNNLSKVYQRREGAIKALSALNLDIQRGEIFGLLGPNGAGKTTAVKMIMGFLHPSTGKVSFQNNKLSVTEPRIGIGYLPERFRPNPCLCVGEYIALQCRLSGIASNDISAEVERLLQLVGMASVADRTITDLSKGMAQRVGLAQAFTGSPALLILDEPTSGLDPLGRRKVMDLLMEMKKEKKTIFFCSHILSEVEHLCDRIGILVGGSLRFIGPAENFMDKWQVDDLEQAFIQEALCVKS